MSEPLDEIRRKLREAGVPEGGAWKGSPEKIVKSSLVEGQREHLVKLKALLQNQIEADVQKVAELHASLEKLKHGGG